jgi:hypothetical protein
VGDSGEERVGLCGLNKQRKGNLGQDDEGIACTPNFWFFSFHFCLSFFQFFNFFCFLFLYFVFFPIIIVWIFFWPIFEGYFTYVYLVLFFIFVSIF